MHPQPRRLSHAAKQRQLNGNDLRFSNSIFLLKQDFGGGGRNHNLTKITMSFLPEVRDGAIVIKGKNRKKKRHKKWRKFLKSKKTKKAKKPDYNTYIRSWVWNAVKKSYFTRNKKVCAACNASSYIVLHHINYGRLGKELDSDLIALCRGCHNELHETHGRAAVMKGQLAPLTYAFIEERQQELIMEEIAKRI